VAGIVIVVVVRVSLVPIVSVLLHAVAVAAPFPRLALLAVLAARVLLADTPVVLAFLTISTRLAVMAAGARSTFLDTVAV